MRHLLALVCLVPGACGVLRPLPESSMEGTLVPEIAASPEPAAPQVLLSLTAAAMVDGELRAVAEVVAVEDEGRVYLLKPSGSRRFVPGDRLRLLVGGTPDRALQVTGERAGCVEARLAPYPRLQGFPDAWLDDGPGDPRF